MYRERPNNWHGRSNDRFHYSKILSPKNRRSDTYQNNKLVHPTETSPKKYVDDTKSSTKENNDDTTSAPSVNDNNTNSSDRVEENKETDQVVPKTEAPVPILLDKDDLIVISDDETSKDENVKQDKEIDSSIEGSRDISIELELQKLYDDSINVNDINQSKSYLGCFPFFDDYRVVDMDLGTPPPSTKQKSSNTLSTDDLLEQLDDAIHLNQETPKNTPKAHDDSSRALKRKHFDEKSKKPEEPAPSKVAKRRRSCMDDIIDTRENSKDEKSQSMKRRSSLFLENDRKLTYFPNLRSDYTIPKTKQIFSQPDTPCCKPIHTLFSEKGEETSQKKKVIKNTANAEGAKRLCKRDSKKTSDMRKKLQKIYNINQPVKKVQPDESTKPKEGEKDTKKSAEAKKTEVSKTKINKSKKFCKSDNRAKDKSDKTKVNSQKKSKLSENRRNEEVKRVQKDVTDKHKTLDLLKFEEELLQVENKLGGASSKKECKKSNAKSGGVKNSSNKNSHKEDGTTENVKGKEVLDKNEKKSNNSDGKKGRRQNSPNKNYHKEVNQTKCEGATKETVIEKQVVDKDNKKLEVKTARVLNLGNKNGHKELDVATTENVKKKEVFDKNDKKLNVSDLKNAKVQNLGNKRHHKELEDVTTENIKGKDVLDKNEKDCKKLNVSDAKNGKRQNSPNKNNHKVYQIKCEDVTTKNVTEKDLVNENEKNNRKLNMSDVKPQNSPNKNDHKQVVQTKVEDVTIKHVTEKELGHETEKVNRKLIMSDVKAQNSPNKNDHKEDDQTKFEAVTTKKVTEKESGNKNEKASRKLNVSEVKNVEEQSLANKNGHKEVDQKKFEDVTTKNVAEKESGDKNEKVSRKLNVPVAKVQNLANKNSHKDDENLERTLKSSDLCIEPNENISKEITKDLFDLKESENSTNQANHKLKILSDLEDTSIQLVDSKTVAATEKDSSEDQAGLAYAGVIYTKSNTSAEEEEELRNFESAYVKDMSMNEAKESMNDKIETDNPESINTPEDVCKELDELFNLFNAATSKVTKESPEGDDKSIKEEKDAVAKEQLIVIKTAIKSETNETVETCKQLIIEHFPPLQKIRPAPTELECCERAVLIESPDVRSSVSCAVDQSQEVIEIVEDIPLIDLTNDSLETNVLDESKEKITLYRSDETSIGSPDVLATSASLSFSALLRQPVKDENAKEIKDETPNNDPVIKETLTLKNLLQSGNNDAPNTNRTAAAAKTNPVVSSANQIPPTFAQINSSSSSSVIVAAPINRISYDPSSIVDTVRRASLMQDSREDNRNGIEQLMPAPVATRSGQFCQNVASTQNIERNGQAAKETFQMTSQQTASSQPRGNPPPYYCLSNWQLCVSEYIWLVAQKTHLDEQFLGWMKTKNFAAAIYANELKIMEKIREYRLMNYSKDLMGKFKFMNLVENQITPHHITAVWEYLKQRCIPISLLQTYTILWKLMELHHDFYSNHPMLRMLYNVVLEVVKAIIAKSDTNRGLRTISTQQDLLTSEQRFRLRYQINFYNDLTKRLRAATIPRPVYYPPTQNQTFNLQYKPAAAPQIIKNNHPQQILNDQRRFSHNVPYSQEQLNRRLTGAVAQNPTFISRNNNIQNLSNMLTQLTPNVTVVRSEFPASSQLTQLLNKSHTIHSSPPQRPLLISPQRHENIPDDNPQIPLFKAPNSLQSTKAQQPDPTESNSSIPREPARTLSPNREIVQSNEIIPSNGTDGGAVETVNRVASIPNETIPSSRAGETSDARPAPADEVIDLTWLDDFKTEELEEAVECIIKKEEPVDDDDEVVLNQEQFPVAYSPSDSGVEGSPSPQCEVSELVFVGRYCICDKPAEYICGCRLAMYCSNYCQNKDWTEHKKICLRVTHR